MTPAVQLLMATATLFLGACSTSLAPIEVAAGCPDQPLRGPQADADSAVELLIDDFEDPAPTLPLIRGRDGTWAMGKDDTGTLLVSESSNACAARGLRAGHFAGKDFTVWGANWNAVLHPATSDGTAVPYDASAYSGISLWAATTPESSPLTIPFGVITMDTAYNSELCAYCMDTHHVDVTLTSTWQKVTIPFASMKQYGYGDPQIAVRPEVLVAFLIWPRSGSFDVWIDDLRFVP